MGKEARPDSGLAVCDSGPAVGELKKIGAKVVLIQNKRDRSRHQVLYAGYMNKHPMVVLWLLWQLSFFIVCSNSTLVKDGTGTCEKSTIHLRKLGGPGCPYTASWLVHVNLYRTVRYWTDITKMEAASFTMFERALLKFQFADHDAYYVHHMSLYEHVNHKAHGFEVAKNKSMEMARAAVEGECSAQLKPDKRSQTVALIPFYGGLPPNVTKDLSVKSLGQGNSLVRLLSSLPL